MDVSESDYTVAIVVDPAFGKRLEALAQRMPVWVAATPSNQAAAEAHWRVYPQASSVPDVTVFRVDYEQGPGEWCAEVVGAVIEHHGVHSHDPPVSVLLVIGAKPTPGPPARARHPRVRRRKRDTRRL